MASIADWRTLAASKRESVASKIPSDWRVPQVYLSKISPKADIGVLNVPRECGVLTDREIELTEKYDATALIEMMVKGALSSLEVTTAFCKRAAIAQQLVNCCTELMFEEALVRAKQCDDYLAKEGKPMGKMHGLPVSLKDSFNVKGTQTTIGYVSFIAHPPATTNSVLVDILFKEGAVFYVKTNLPQTMMTADSDNNVFGRTLNPNKLSLTAGGSTGGEGALLKMRGSVLGLATDIAGSIRIPALCDGVVGFKGTAGRVPFSGGVPPGRLGSPGQILPVIGPLCHSVRDAALLTKTIIDTEPWEMDEGTVAVPWRQVQLPSKPLRFGLIREDLKRPLHPTIQRCLHTAATALKSSGHTIVDLTDKIPPLWASIILTWKYFLLDPQKVPSQHINASGEPEVPSISTASMTELSDWTPSLDTLWDMNVERRKILRAYRELIVENQLDAILMPGYQATAVPHDTFGIPPYTSIINLLDYPASILPFLQASKELDAPFVRDNVTYEPPYAPETFEGAPGHVQLIGKPMKDEELMKITEMVHEILKTVA